MKEFIIENPEVPPPKSTRKINQIANCSETYFGIAENDLNEIRKCLCYYDFTAKEWCFVGVGKKKLIEYYIEK
jgi:histidinol-phosphate/aromatic aminotransferase/cobyric acid decarboxylase-like protein